MKMFVNLLLSATRLSTEVRRCLASSWSRRRTDRVRLQQAEAVDGGAVDGGEIGVVGFVAGVGRLSELLGGKGGPCGPQSRPCEVRWTGP